MNIHSLRNVRSIQGRENPKSRKRVLFYLNILNSVVLLEKNIRDVIIATPSKNIENIPQYVLLLFTII